MSRRYPSPMLLLVASLISEPYTNGRTLPQMVRTPWELVLWSAPHPWRNLLSRRGSSRAAQRAVVSVPVLMYRLKHPASLLKTFHSRFCRAFCSCLRSCQPRYELAEWFAKLSVFLFIGHLGKVRIRFSVITSWYDTLRKSPYLISMKDDDLHAREIVYIFLLCSHPECVGYGMWKEEDM